MRGTVSKKMSSQAKSETLGQYDWQTRKRKQELKSEYLEKKRSKFIKPVKESKRQLRRAIL